MYEIKFFSNDIENFISDLEKPAIAKLIRGIDLLETYSSRIGMPWVKNISKNLYELRIKGKQEIRIFFTERDKQIILLSVYKKQTNKAPVRELEKAKSRLLQL